MKPINEPPFAQLLLPNGLLEVLECGEYSGFQSATLKITSVSLTVVSSELRSIEWNAELVWSYDRAMY